MDSNFERMIEFVGKHVTAGQKATYTVSDKTGRLLCQ
jgi:hypothetical protein